MISVFLTYYSWTLQSQQVTPTRLHQQNSHRLWCLHIPAGVLFWPLTDKNYVQSNLDGSNTDDSFTMAISNSFLSPYEILLIAQENKYLRKFSYFIVKLYVVCTH